MQWHPELGTSPELGPSPPEMLADARAAGGGELDYVAAQAYARGAGRDALPRARPPGPLRAARRLRTSTLFGAFELDPESGLQRGHRLAVIRWKRGRRHLLAGRVAGSSGCRAA